MHSRKPERTLLNSTGPIQHLEIALPKPGVRGSSPLRDAILRTTFDIQTCTGMNWRATVRRGDGSEKQVRGKRLSRGYTVVTGSMRVAE
jgi:hypothetical protein